MKKILRKKWMGFLIVCVYALAIAILLGWGTAQLIEEMGDDILNETAEFLPMTVENGEITEPADKEIEKVYTFDDGDTFRVILNTRIDEFSADDLSKNGIYVSKKCFFVTTPEKTEGRCFSPTMKPITITQDDVKEGLEFMKKYGGYIFFAAALLFIVIIFYMAIAIYTCLMHWIIALWFKRTFSQTFHVNTWMYVLIQLLETGGYLRFGFWATFALMLAANLIASSKDDTEQRIGQSSVE